ncbi:hypothetical protein ACVBEG_27600 [Pseudomonas sp. GG8]
MPSTHMKLKILLPFKVFADKVDVLRIVAESHNCFFGLLPQRLDCVSSCTGISGFTAETAQLRAKMRGSMRGYWSKPGARLSLRDAIAVRHWLYRQGRRAAVLSIWMQDAAYVCSCQLERALITVSAAMT